MPLAAESRWGACQRHGDVAPWVSTGSAHGDGVGGRRLWASIGMIAHPSLSLWDPLAVELLWVSGCLHQEGLQQRPWVLCPSQGLCVNHLGVFPLPSPWPG